MSSHDDRDPAGGSPLRFQHVREIARGGMGRVSEAVDTYLDRTVALKEALDANPASHARFAREVAITARLEHPSIVPVYDAGTTEDGAPFYVMRRVSGQPFDRVIVAASSLDQRLRLLPHMLAVADAVAHAHQRGIIHRDLKPSNVLIGELGETVVIDWGLAKVIGEADTTAPTVREVADPALTRAGAVIGTPGFMPPEQARGGEVDARTDVYALGACLYYLLVGRAPPGGSLAGVPTELTTIVERAMAADPAVRYEDAGGVGEELRRFLGGQLVASHHYSAATRLARWIRRRAVRSVIVAAAVVLAVIGALSIRRVLAERTRAELALAQERERSEELIVTQAASYLDTNPTLAVATLQLLPVDSPRWEHVAAIAAQARASGVAVGFPGDGPDTHARLAPDGLHALTFGDGEVRLDDLARQTSAVIDQHDGALLGAEWCGATAVIARRGGVVLVDPITLAQHEIAMPGTLAQWAAAGPVVAVLRDSGELSALDPRDAAPQWRAITDGATSIALGPAGGWIVVGKGTRTMLWRRDDDGHAWRPQLDLDLALVAAAFEAGEPRVAIASEAGDVREIDLGTSRPYVTRSWSVPGAGELAYAAGVLSAHLAANEKLAWITLADAGRTGGRDAARVVEAQGAVVMQDGQRRIVVTAGSARYVISAPEIVTELVAHPDSARVLGVGIGRVMAWDLRELAGDAVPIAVAGPLVAAAPGRVIATTGFGQLAGYDVATGRASPIALDDIDAPWTLRAFDDGSVIATGAVAHDAQVVAPAGARIELAAVTAIAPRDATTWLVGSHDGGVQLVDRATGRAEAPFARLAAPVDTVLARDGWMVAQAADGSIVRRDPDGHDAHLEPRAPGTWLAAIGEGGVAYLALGRDLVAWRPDGASGPVATLAADVREVCAGAAIAVVTEDGAVARLEGAPVAISPPSASVQLATDCSRVASIVDGGLVVADVALGDSWRVVDHVTSRGFALLDHGRTLVTGEATPHGDALRLWHLPARSSPQAWVRGATNALPPGTSRGASAWRPL